MTKTKLTIAGIVLAVIVLVAVGVLALKPSQQGSREILAGAPGNMLAENYTPYIGQNGGYFSALPIKTSSTLDVTGVTTLSGATAVSGAATLTSTFKLGSSGTALNSFVDGTCNPVMVADSFPATSSVAFMCSVSGVTAGDIVMADLPKGAGAVTGGGPGSLFGGFVLGNAYSTTTGVVGFSIYNGTGAATTSFAQATTGVEIIDLR